jgi:hypothetical protein
MTHEGMWRIYSNLDPHGVTIRRMVGENRVSPVKRPSVQRHFRSADISVDVFKEALKFDENSWL